MDEFIGYLPHVNASLNATAFVFTMAGLIAIKAQRVELHKKLMLAAVSASALFLTSYLIYHFNAAPVKFGREGTIRTVYLAILFSHIVLAIVVAPLVLVTTWLGVKDRLAKHKQLAKITAPIWLYVSVTGVVIYWMLYRM